MSYQEDPPRGDIQTQTVIVQGKAYEVATSDLLRAQRDFIPGHGVAQSPEELAIYARQLGTGERDRLWERLQHIGEC